MSCWYNPETKGITIGDIAEEAIAAETTITLDIKLSVYLNPDTDEYNLSSVIGMNTLDEHGLIDSKQFEEHFVKHNQMSNFV
jgi:hypothetical protein